MKLNATYYLNKTTTAGLRRLAQRKQRSAGWIIDQLVAREVRRLAKAAVREGSLGQKEKQQ